jgi:hypothetical protein
MSFQRSQSRERHAPVQRSGPQSLTWMDDTYITYELLEHMGTFLSTEMDRMERRCLNESVDNVPTTQALVDPMNVCTQRLVETMGASTGILSCDLIKLVVSVVHACNKTLQDLPRESMVPDIIQIVLDLPEFWELVRPLVQAENQKRN